MSDGSATGVDYAPYQDQTDEDNALTGDLDDTFTPVEDDRVLLWDALKMLTTPSGNLPWAPTATLSLLDEINGTSTSSSRAALKARAEALFQTDQRMDVTVDLGWAPSTGKLSPKITVRAVKSGKLYQGTIEPDGSLTVAAL